MSRPSRRLVVATRNAHKLREFRRLLPALALEQLPAGVELPPEDGDSFAANALIKARAAAAATGVRSLADDSGIEAAALGGRPGIHSARYAGPEATDAENLARLRDEAPAGSPLRFVCALAVADPAGREELFFGDCRGTLAPAPRGEHGFGYDPVFLVEGDARGRTMAELSDAEKDEISHRGAAARQLLARLGD
jgi:XTP/dITP diphosphohydrolase